MRQGVSKEINMMRRDELIDLVILEARSHSEMIVSLYISSDQRAASLASTFIAAATVLIGALLAVPKGILSASLILGGSVSAIMFLFAGFICAWVIRSVQFYGVGSPPRAWFDDLQGSKDALEAKQQFLQIIDRHLQEDKEYLKITGKRFNISVFFGLLAPIAGVIVWFLANLLYRS